MKVLIVTWVGMKETKHIIGSWNLYVHNSAGLLSKFKCSLYVMKIDGIIFCFMLLYVKCDILRSFFRTIKNLFYLFSKHNMSRATESLRIPYLEGISTKNIKSLSCLQTVLLLLVHMYSQRYGLGSNSLMTRWIILPLHNAVLQK